MSLTLKGLTSVVQNAKICTCVREVTRVQTLETDVHGTEQVRTASKRSRNRSVRVRRSPREIFRIRQGMGASQCTTSVPLKKEAVYGLGPCVQWLDAAVHKQQQ
jgi:hypothetical protein